MPGSVFRSGGMIGIHSTSTTASPSSHYTNSVIKAKNSLSEIEFQKRRNLWPTTAGNLSLINDFTYYWDAAVPYSYPTTGGSTWYDLRGGNQYLYSNNGTFAGNAVYSSEGGGSIYLDGTGDWITSFPSAISNATTRTVGVFFKTPSSSFQTLIANRVASDNGWAIIINPTASIAVRVSHFTPTTDYTLDSIAGISLATDTWYHVTYTYDRTASDAYSYINGAGVASDVTFANDTSSAFNGVIGAGTSAFAFPFTGYIGLVYISNLAFSGSDVLTVHNTFKGRFGIL